MRWLALVAVMVVVRGVFAAQTSGDGEQDNGVTIIADIPYYDGEDADRVRHTLDLYLPQTEAPFPLVFYVHGGAWVGGSKDSYANIGRALAAEGLGVVIVNYRLSPGVTHPAHVQDLARAFAWVMDSIEAYGGDPTRIVLTGHSAGGHMVSLLVLDPAYLEAVGYAPEDVAGVVAFSGVFVIDDWIVQWARGAFPADAAGRAAASPLALIPHEDQTVPPFLLLVSEDDYPELIVETQAMTAMLEEAGVDAQAAIIADREHFTLVTRIGAPGDETTRLLADWLDAIFTTEEE